MGTFGQSFLGPELFLGRQRNRMKHSQPPSPPKDSTVHYLMLFFSPPSSFQHLLILSIRCPIVLVIFRGLVLSTCLSVHGGLSPSPRPGGQVRGPAHSSCSRSILFVPGLSCRRDISEPRYFKELPRQPSGCPRPPPPCISSNPYNSLGGTGTPVTKEEAETRR